MHNVRFLWMFHQIHHSAEVITPITHYRIHPVESWLYDLRGALVTGTVAGSFYWVFRGSVSDFTLLGVPALGFVFNMTTGNLRHSHVWLRFPPMIERWLISPAQHQLHHSLDEEHYGSNYGTWLAIWDRMVGSLVVSTEVAPLRYGIPSDERITATTCFRRGLVPSEPCSLARLWQLESGSLRWLRARARMSR